MTRYSYCRCCERPKAAYAERKVPHDLPAAQIVCDLCARHQGSHPSEQQRRDRLHIEMWQEEMREALEARDEKHSTEIARCHERMDELNQELSERPIQVVETNLDAEHIQQVETEADRAFRSRDQAYIRLARLHMLHYDVDGEKCRCGAGIDSCPVAAVVDTFRGLHFWERRQADRRRSNRDHLLPKGHPGVIDARWDPDEDDRWEDDDYSWEYEARR